MWLNHKTAPPQGALFTMELLESESLEPGSRWKRGCYWGPGGVKRAVKQGFFKDGKGDKEKSFNLIETNSKSPWKWAGPQKETSI